MFQEQLSHLLAQAQELHARNQLSATVGPDYFEPGKMEYLEQSDGQYDKEAGILTLRFEARGTRYEGRTEQIESVKLGDEIWVVREPENKFNANNFRLLTRKQRDVGNMPAELCNAIAPLYDSGHLTFLSARVSFVEPLSRRSRYARQAVLFVELRCLITAE